MKQEKKEGKISGILIYKKNGETPVPCTVCELSRKKGIDGDWHGSDPVRQISILPAEVRGSQKEGFCLKKFKENLQIEGLDFSQISPGTLLKAKETILEVTGVFKKCYPDLCELAKTGENCLLREQAVFAKVIKEGKLYKGEIIKTDVFRE